MQRPYRSPSLEWSTGTNVACRPLEAGRSAFTGPFRIAASVGIDTEQAVLDVQGGPSEG